MNDVRSALFVAWLYGSMAAVGIAFFPTWLIGRRLAAHAMRAWAQAVVWGLRHIMGVRLAISGRQYLPDGPFILAGKHQSMFETIAIFLVLRDPAVVFKKELYRMPFFGWYCWRTGQLVVDRGAHASALKSLIRRAKEKAAAGRPIVIFPEGTRQALDAPPDYKPGVAGLYRQLNLPVIPMALNSGYCWPRHGFRRRPGMITLEFLPPIEPGMKAEAFMRRLESEIEPATRRLVETALSEARSAPA